MWIAEPLFSRDPNAWGDALARLQRDLQERGTVLTGPQFDEAVARSWAVVSVEFAAQLSRPMPGAAEMLRQLTTTGSRWAVVSDGVKADVQARLERAGLPIPAVFLAQEDFVPPNFEEGTSKQWSADPWRHAMALLGVDDPSRVMACDDTDKALTTASSRGAPAWDRAGCFAVGIATNHTQWFDLVADAVVPDLSSIAVTMTPGGIQATISSTLNPPRDVPQL